VVDQPAFMHVADLHLGAKLGGHSLEEDLFARWGQAVDIAIQRKVKAVIFAGDVFDRRLTFREGMRLAGRFCDACLPLAQNGIPLLVLGGNHDPDEWLLALQHAVRLASARVGDNRRDQQPLIIVRNPEIIRLGGVQFVCLPYPDHGRLAELAGHDFSGEKDPRIERNRAVAAGMQQVLQKMIDSDRFQANIPAVLVAHITTTNARIPDRDEQQEGYRFDWTGDPMLPARAVPNRFVYGAFGHVHAPQDLHGSDPGCFAFPARYSGSLVPLNASEADQEKSVTLVAVRPDHSVGIEVVPLDRTRLVEMEVALADLPDLEARKDEYEGAFVKVTVNHDGSVPRATITRRVHRVFSRIISLRLIGPALSVRSTEERLVEAMGAARAQGSTWNPEDHVGTVREYLKEVYAEHSRLGEVLEIAELVVREAERIHLGEGAPAAPVQPRPEPARLQPPADKAEEGPACA
jgi:DNA repair protein SbcD/Mre11